MTQLIFVTLTLLQTWSVCQNCEQALIDIRSILVQNIHPSDSALFSRMMVPPSQSGLTNIYLISFITRRELWSMWPLRSQLSAGFNCECANTEKHKEVSLVYFISSILDYLEREYLYRPQKNTILSSDTIYIYCILLMSYPYE